MLKIKGNTLNYSSTTCFTVFPFTGVDFVGDALFDFNVLALGETGCVSVSGAIIPSIISSLKMPSSSSTGLVILSLNEHAVNCLSSFNTSAS